MGSGSSYMKHRHQMVHRVAEDSQRFSLINKQIIESINKHKCGGDVGQFEENNEL